LLSDKSILFSLVLAIPTIYLNWPFEHLFKIVPINDHLIPKLLAVGREGGRRTTVIGHRGGGFGPENTIKCFKGAIANGVEGIEFDVSFSFFKSNYSFFFFLILYFFRSG